MPDTANRSRSHRRRQQGEEAATALGLLDNLIAYWPGDEASGHLLDAHTNGLNLADGNTVTNNPGHLYTTARQYTGANSERHSRPSETLLQCGNIDFTVAAWVCFDSGGPDTYATIMTKWSSSERAFLLCRQKSSGKYRLLAGNGSSGSIGDVTADNFGAAALAAWHLVISWHDSIANTLNIQVNNGAVDSSATTGEAVAAGAPFNLGSVVTTTYRMDGRIGPSAFWKSAAEAGGVLTEAQRTALWNEGAGLTYAQLT